MISNKLVIKNSLMSNKNNQVENKNNLRLGLGLGSKKKF
jgi:hypothetical protein